MPGSDRRRVYRQPGERCAGLALKLRLVDGRPLEGRVVDVSAGGLGARSAGDTAVAAGQHVDVEVRDADGARTSLAAEVLEPERRDHVWRFGLRFMSPPAPGAVDARSFYQTFNRRGAYRVPVDERDDVAVELAVAGDTGVAEEIGAAELRNLSASGAGLLAPQALDLRLGGRTRLLVSMALPGLAAPLTLAADVRNAARSPDGVYLGIEFDTDSADYLGNAEEIVEFVLNRLDAPPPA